ncbi:MAG TPA: hypothetical protein VF173_09015 [Thermoanaerobaculia bacterium]|nr:hypothetical protein [Thermoanaerobaculia bacterium]
MRKFSIIALVFCLILGLSVVAMAKDTVKTAKGAVTAVSTTDNSITLKGKTANETYWLNDKTKIDKSHKKIALTDVKEGDWAEVWFTSKDGKDWATKIVVKAAAKDKAAAAKSGS